MNSAELQTPTLRKAQTGDAEALAVVGAATFIETFGGLYQPADLQKFLAKNHSAEVYAKLLADNSWGLWLAETEDGAPVGYCAAGPCSLPVPDQPENSGELARLYLLKAHQGGGLGRALLTIGLDFLRARFAHVYLSVYEKNYGAQRLYQRHGFVKVHDYFYMVGDHADPEWIMKLAC